MKLLTTMLEAPIEAFGSLQNVDVYHYTKPAEKQAPYGIWKEESDDSFNSDNQRSERVLNGILDYYTLDESDTHLDELEQAMIDMGASWQLTAIQFEEQTNLIHFSWDWSIT